ncbi:uncharacterized protein LOC115644514 [Gopherus evgoodei]|nr:uncharacterized protein LOC115644514 [Gopherus evgoodei]
MFLLSGIETEREKHTPVKQDTAWEAVVKAMATGWNRDHESRGITQGGKISQETFIDTYDPSVLRREQYMLYEIKWSNNKRPRQNCCHSTQTEHAEIYFLEDVFQKQRSDPSAHCFITWFVSWSPCGDCCKQIRDFLKEQPNVKLFIYVARIYWHKREINRQGLRNLMNIGVSIRVMYLPVYRYCWRTFVDKEDKYEDYWPRHFAPWIMLYSLELQSILQNIPSCLKISSFKNQSPVFSLCVDEKQKRALALANPYYWGAAACCAPRDTGAGCGELLGRARGPLGREPSAGSQPQTGIETEREKHTPVKQDTAWEAVVKAMASGWNRDHESRGITQGWKISQEDFVENYDPSVLPSVTYLLYEIKWNHRRRHWQRWICSAGGEHAETYFLEDIYRKLRSNPFVHCSITCYISWSPCGYCCQEIMDFLEKMPNVNLVIYVARLYWHKEETNRQGLWNLENIGVSIQVMDLPDYNYCWRTFVDDEDKYDDEDDYWPRHFAPWIMLYSLELQSILQNIPSCLEVSSDENYTPVFSLCVEDEEQKRALTSANPY